MKNSVAIGLVLAISLLVVSCNRHGAPAAHNAQTDALFRATIEGNTDMVKSLLSSPGADVNATNERGSTPLLEAARYGHDDICRVLIAAGADVKAKDKDGKTALMLAVQGDHDQVVRVLKQAGETE
ncbi:MAG TPA: ankyrin repeat domain-containing protein [Pyrinomonadaceae bacterium]|jgi:ankyrin repeat protein|nr:ankyrin repeat domain-containing protein [Pyrinomonadaceae bacterium]